MEPSVSHGASSSGSGKRTRHSGKSRLGCKTCKTRKIKVCDVPLPTLPIQGHPPPSSDGGLLFPECDEGYPECAKCVSFGVPCDFLPSEERSVRLAAARPEREHGATGDHARRRGRPRKDWIQWTAGHLILPEPGPSDNLPRQASEEGVNEQDTLQSSALPLGNASVSSPKPHALTPTPGLHTEDLFLFHHYMTATAPTIGHPHVWRDGVPSLGQEFPGLFHGMLAVAAYHMAKTQVVRAPKLRVIAERHYASAVRAAMSMTANMSIENAQAAYASATLVCFTSFAKGPSPGDLVLVGDQGVVPWVRLLRGVRLILRTFGSSVILSGILDPNRDVTHWPNGCTCPLKDERPRGQRFEMSHGGWDWKSSLAALDETVASSMSSDQAVVFRPQIAGLVRCYQSLTEDKDNKNYFEANGEDFVSVISWVFFLEDPFTDALVRRDSLSLIILGFYGILLGSLRGYWWLEGWGDHVVVEVRRLLGAEYDAWLPRRHGSGVS